MIYSANENLREFQNTPKKLRNVRKFPEPKKDEQNLANQDMKIFQPPTKKVFEKRLMKRTLENPLNKLTILKSSEKRRIVKKDLVKSKDIFTKSSSSPAPVISDEIFEEKLQKIITQPPSNSESNYLEEPKKVHLTENAVKSLPRSPVLKTSNTSNSSTPTPNVPDEIHIRHLYKARLNI